MTDNRNSLQIHGDNHGDLINYNRYFIHLRTRTAIGMAVICGLVILLAIAGAIVCFRLLPTGKPVRRSTPVVERVVFEGARGGKYYLNANGNKVYLPRDTPVTIPEAKRIP